MSPEDRSRSYADAFYQAAVERWLAALQSVEDRLEQQPELCGQLQADNIDFAQRQRIVDGILPADVDPPVRNLLYTLVQNGDLDALEGIIGALRQHTRGAGAGPTEVEIVSAVPLDDGQRQALLSKLEQQHGDALDVRYRVDAAILGGLVIRVGDKLIDNSVATRLAAMRHALGIPTAG